MKILLTEWFRQWRGAEPQVVKPAGISLDDQKMVFALVVSLANGDYDEVSIETDSIEAKECITGMLCGTGNAKQVEASPEVEQCRLYQAGYEIYRQGTDSYFFVNPVPRPELF